MNKYLTILKVILTAFAVLILIYVIATIITTKSVLEIVINTIVGHCAIFAIWEWIPSINNTHDVVRIKSRGNTNEK